MLVKHRLLNFGDNIIYQDDDWFNFSLDSVILTNFVKLRKNDNNILDLCTGNAPIPMMLKLKNDKQLKITGIEIQKEIYLLAKNSVIENKMDSIINIINDDVKNADKILELGSFDVITCNPPYFKIDENSYLSENNIKRIARHEVCISLDDIFRVSKHLLKNSGKLCMVHRPDRLSEIFNKLKNYNLEPKRLMFVSSRLESSPNMVLIEAVLNGQPGLVVEPILITHESDGSYTKVIKKMFD